MQKKVVLFGLSMFDWPKFVNDYEIVSIAPYKKLNLRQSLLRSVFIRLNPVKATPFFNIDKIIQHINDTEVLIVGDGMPYDIINTIVKLVDNAVTQPKYKIIYLINPAKDLSKLHLTASWSIKTFDYNDHIKWGCQYVSTFHVPLTMPTADIKYDVFFIGKNKGRFKIIRNIERNIANLGLKCKFLYVSKLHVFSKRYSPTIPYSKALSLLNTSCAILDISQQGQMGLTQRFMESIFYKKKIITNNKTIRKYKIFNERNMYILSDNFNFNELVKFLSEPYDELDYSLVCWYDPQHWLKRILSDNNTDSDLV